MNVFPTDAELNRVYREVIGYLGTLMDGDSSERVIPLLRSFAAACVGSSSTAAEPLTGLLFHLAAVSRLRDELATVSASLLPY